MASKLSANPDFYAVRANPDFYAGGYTTQSNTSYEITVAGMAVTLGLTKEEILEFVTRLQRNWNIPIRVLAVTQYYDDIIKAAYQAKKTKGE